MGGIGVSGKLPVTANSKFKEGDGVTSKKIRLAFGEPARLAWTKQFSRELTL